MQPRGLTVGSLDTAFVKTFRISICSATTDDGNVSVTSRLAKNV